VTQYQFQYKSCNSAPDDVQLFPAAPSCLAIELSTKACLQIFSLADDDNQIVVK